MKPKKNVAIIVERLRNGGAERAAGNLSRELSNSYNVYLFLYDISNQVYSYGGQIIHIGRDGRDYTRYYMRQYKRELSIDVAISFSWETNYENVLTRGQEKVIISERCSESPFYGSRLYERCMARTLYPMADVIVAVSEGVRKDLIGIYGIEPNKIVTIYNFCYPDKFVNMANVKPICLPRFFSNDIPLIITIGRLDKQKNQNKLLTQFKYLLDKGMQANLLIIGSGPIYEDLVCNIAKMGLEGNVMILPYCENPFGYLGMADVFVLSSHYEGLPNVLAEAMSVGVPIVSTDCLAGPRELLMGNSDYGGLQQGYILTERGILVADAESDDTGATHFLADGIQYMISNREYSLKCVDNAKTYLQGYSNDDVLKKWIRVIESYTAIKIEDNCDLKGKKLVIYGAGKYGQTLLASFQNYGLDVYAMAISDTLGVAKEVQGVPVRAIDELANEMSDIVVVLGVITREYIDEILRKLIDLGFKFFLRLAPLPIDKHIIYGKAFGFQKISLTDIPKLSINLDM